MRTRFVLQVRLKPGCEDEFLRLYVAIRDRVARGVPGCLAHEAGQAVDDSLAWIVTSEWRERESYEAWERDAEHRALTAPLRALFAEARLTKYTIREGIGLGEEER